MATSRSKTASLETGDVGVESNLRSASSAGSTPGKPSAIDTIAGQVRELLGGDNPHQFFTLLMPGTIVEPSRYTYDINGTKPASVAVAESRLVNQLFDVCQVTASANGRHLGTQYIAALNLLVPRFSPELTTVKNALRGFLRSNPTWTKPDGSPYTGTVQDLYFELYQAWVEKKQKWELEMQSQQDTLQAQFPDNPRRARDEFIEWYQSVAEGRLLELDALMGKVLAFFSPSDMKAILGALDSGPGREIYEARSVAQNAERPSPDGGSVFPVNLTPADWFTSLISEEKPQDLLDDPKYIALKLYARRSALGTTVDQVKALLATRTGDLNDLRDKVDAAQQAYDDKQKELVGQFGKNLLAAYDLYKAAQGPGSFTGGGAPASVVSAIADGKNSLDKESKRKGEATGDEAKGDDDKFKKALAGVIDGQNELVAARSAFMASVRNLNKAATAFVTAQATNYDMQPYLARLQTQLDEVGKLENELAIAVRADAPIAPGGAPTGGTPTVATAASEVSDRFMNVTMSFHADSMSSQTSVSSMTSQSSFNLDLFFGSYSGSSEYSTANSAKNILNSNKSVEIGMKVTKVDIDRPWFDPGVFQTTRDLDRMSTSRISVGPVDPSTEANMRLANDAILPAYPVSFVIAKDITIRFEAADSQLNAAKSVIDSKSAYGGGFLCFTASSASSSHHENESVTSKSQDNTITIRINAPQIIGWFSEFIPVDRSTELVTSTASQDSVLAFIQQSSAQLRPPATVSEPLALAGGTAPPSIPVQVNGISSALFSRPS